MTFKFSDCSLYHILVIGDVMLDRYLWGEVSRISPEAPVPVVRVGQKTKVLGGAGNVAANVAGLGCQVTLVGLCGDDADGRELQTMLREVGVRDQLLLNTTRPTITKTRIMAQDQQLLRLDEEAVQPPTEQEQQQIIAFLQENLSRFNAVILSDYDKGQVTSLGLCREIIRSCSDKSVPVLVDPKGENWERYRGATCITPNTMEFHQVVDGRPDDGPELLAEINTVQKQFDFDWLLLTRGARGMCLFPLQGEPVDIPTRAREVFDVSGAGDTVIATLAVGVAAGLSFPEAARLANSGAGLVVGKLGTQPVNREELQAALHMNGHEGEVFASKVKTTDLPSAVRQALAWQQAGEKVVFTNGCFDLLHPGHVNLLHQARTCGDRLIIGLNTDCSVKQLKGESRPILAEQDRAAILSALECVDLVVLFAEQTPLNLIEAIQPDILVKGADYALDQVVGREIVESYDGEVRLIQLTEGYSTTGLIEKKNHGRPS